jgi:hypothetical protein
LVLQYLAIPYIATPPTDPNWDTYADPQTGFTDPQNLTASPNGWHQEFDTATNHGHQSDRVSALSYYQGSKYPDSPEVATTLSRTSDLRRSTPPSRVLLSLTFNMSRIFQLTQPPRRTSRRPLRMHSTLSIRTTTWLTYMASRRIPSTSRRITLTRPTRTWDSIVSS